MTVRVGEFWSSPLPVYGGVPQGSILGVFLFNVATDNLEDPGGACQASDDSDDSPAVEAASSDDSNPSPGTRTSTPAPCRPGYVLPADDSPVRARPTGTFLPRESNTVRGAMAARAARSAVRRIEYSSEEEEACLLYTSPSPRD